MWVVTKEVNEYNQRGDYLVCVFENKPSFKDLKKVLPYETDGNIEKLLCGESDCDGYATFYLTQLNSGELYTPK